MVSGFSPAKGRGGKLGQAAFEAQGHFGRDCSAAVEHPRQHSAGHAKLRGGVGHAQAQGRKNILPEHFARLRRPECFAHDFAFTRCQAVIRAKG
jgi:hypothetical protein